MKIRLCTYYSKSLHDYLNTCGNDVSRIDDAAATRGELTFIASHHRTPTGWKKGLTATDRQRPSEYLEENAILVDPEDFYEWHGGERVHGGF